MNRQRAAMRVWLAGLLAVALLVIPFIQASHTRAADSSLVIAALRMLEQAYVDPIQPVPLLNAAVATLRRATNQGTDALPNIAQGTPEAQADAQFASEFSQAAATGAMPETQLAYAAPRECCSRSMTAIRTTWIPLRSGRANANS
jgi:hypothetical protein